MKKRLISIFWAICVILIILPISVRAEGSEATVVNTVAELKAAISAAPTDGTEKIIEIGSDMRATSEIDINGNKNIVIKSIGSSHYTITRDNTYEGYLLGLDSVGTGTPKLTLKDVTLDGNATNVTATDQIVCMWSGEFIMDTGAYIQNVKGDSGWNTCGIYISSGCTMTMKAGSELRNIENTTGYGAILVDGTISMNGGSITGCKGYIGGGVAIDSGATFNMSGGSITGNKSDYGGILNRGTFIVSGAPNISGNVKIDGTACNVMKESSGMIVVGAGGLTNSSPIGVSSSTLPMIATPVNITGAGNQDWSSNFTSDDSTYAIRNSGSDANQVVKLVPLPVYTISVSPTSIDFGNKVSGSGVPTYQYVIVTNTGNASLTLTQPTSTNYTIGTLTNTSLAPNSTARFLIQPKTGLGVGSYPETITVSSNYSTSATVSVTYVVTPIPTYTINASPTSKDFGSQEVGSAIPTAQTVTVTNTGNTSLTLTQPTSTNYTIGTLSATTLAAGGTATFTIQPKAGLAVGSYDETITVSSSDSTSASVNVTYAVTAIPTYALVINGSYAVTSGAGSFTSGAAISIDAGTRSGYTFTGWTSSNGGTFANANSAVTTFAMPSNATTITADWSLDSTSGANSGGSSPTTPSTPSTNQIPEAPATVSEQIKVEVKQGETNNSVSNLVIDRTTDVAGVKSDVITYQEEKANETIQKLKEEGNDVARIVIPDTKDEVSKTTVNIPSNSLEVIAKGDISLQIDTQEAKINLPKESLQSVSNSLNKDLYFNIVPIKEEKQKDEVTQRALLEVGILNGTSETGISVISVPVTIETNMPSSAVDITLPLTGISIPTDQMQRETFLSQLAVYVEHSDGTKELLKGEIVEYKEGLLGIKFHITKFSIFTIVNTGSLEKDSVCDVISIDTLANAVITGKKITASVENSTTSLDLQVSVSDKALCNLYSDKACTKEMTDNILKLKVGANKVYIKVAAEDGTTSKVYTLTITRKEAPKKVIIVATKYDFTDAFAGGVLAAQLGGTVICTGISEKDAKKMVSYIKKTYSKQDEIYIIGLGEAVNEDLEKMLKKEGYTNIVNIGGEDKYETAKLIADNIKLPDETKVVLVSGETKPKDADNIQKICAELGYPILFVKTDNLTSYTMEALIKINPSQIYIVGDKTKINTKVIEEIVKKIGLDKSDIIRISTGIDIK